MASIGASARGLVSLLDRRSIYLRHSQQNAARSHRAHCFDAACTVSRRNRDASGYRVILPLSIWLVGLPYIGKELEDASKEVSEGTVQASSPEDQDGPRLI